MREQESVREKLHKREQYKQISSCLKRMRVCAQDCAVTNSRDQVGKTAVVKRYSYSFTGRMLLDSSSNM